MILNAFFNIDVYEKIRHMKKSFPLLFLMVFALFCHAQNEGSKYLKEKINTRHSYFVSSSSFDGFSLYLQVDSLTRRINYHNPIPNQPLNNFVYLEGTKTLKILGYIHPDSLNFYRYSITENDTNQIITDAIPNIKNSSLFRMPNHTIELNLGTYNIENKKIIISYYKTNSKTKVATVIIYNRKLASAKLKHVYIGKFVKGGATIEMENKMELANFTFDSSTKSILFGIENVDLDFLYTTTLKEKSTGKVLFSSNMWNYDFFIPRFPYLNIDKEYFKKEGDYELSIVPKLSWPMYVKALPAAPFVYSFSVEHEEKITFTQKELIKYIAYLIVLLGLITSLFFLFISRRNKTKLLAEQQQKQMAILQLNSVRSQLNPHFLFNSLAGIQNLMNKGEIENANQYLTKFARLTRNVLDNKDLVSLNEEKTLLDDYLQMEQMRFGFQYSINISTDLDAENIEIPAMLLQPFVENAVKHGIAEKGKEGKIEVIFKKQAADLVFNINDNGIGFESFKTYKGLGLELSKNRLSLLNTIYKNTPLVLDIHSSKNGTMITINLTQWL